MSDPVDRLNAALGGRYRLEREIGAGGMATVYLAHDLRHERKVALKVLKPELAAVVGAERFLAEIKTTANLQHPHILPLHDSGAADEFLFYVMPFVQGESLRDKLDRETQLGVQESVTITQKVASALDYSHVRISSGVLTTQRRTNPASRAGGFSIPQSALCNPQFPRAPLRVSAKRQQHDAPRIPPTEYWLLTTAYFPDRSPGKLYKWARPTGTWCARNADGSLTI